MIFDATEYLSDVQRIDNNSNVRRVERGFSEFVARAAEVAVNTSLSKTPAIVELGIGGGGSHLTWKKHFSGAVYGVDLFDKTQQKKYSSDPEFGYYRDHFDRIAADTTNANHLLLQAGVTPLWGYNAYAESTALKVKQMHGEPLDFVLDDAAPFKGAMNGLLAAWKDHVSSTGAIVTETPFGNGTDEISNKSYSQCLDHCYELADQGMVLFDMSEYTKLRNPPLTGHIVSYLGFFATNFSNYNHLLEQYEHNIVAGKQNWKEF